MSRERKTKTEERIEFLAKCLQKGMSRSAAANALAEKDHKVSKSYAITLVYQTFSGARYAVPRTPRPAPSATSKGSKASTKSPLASSRGKPGNLL